MVGTVMEMGDIARCSIGKSNELYNEELLYKLFGINLINLDSAEIQQNFAGGVAPPDKVESEVDTT